MTYWGFVRAQLKSAPVFFLFLFAFGVVLDLVVWGRAVNWSERATMALFATAIFVLLSAWQKLVRSR